MDSKHPKTPKPVSASCGHEHLRFGDGSYAITCIDCRQSWVAVDGRGVPDYTMKAVPMFPPRDTRHDRWVLPRVEPQKS